MRLAVEEPKYHRFRDMQGNEVSESFFWAEDLIAASIIGLIQSMVNLHIAVNSPVLLFMRAVLSNAAVPLHLAISDETPPKKNPDQKLIVVTLPHPHLALTRANS